ncbi:hypothetical protein [Endozoicomonas atrinae]|uniref:hypothetical protein n=1 Tax=Endozoicomonas atrinae TaxID=1333660 RepID=UPI003B00A81A
MYIGSDGRVYQNKFDSIGHGTKVPGYADEQHAINQRLGELRRQQQEYAGQQQQQALNQQQIDQNDVNQFYDRQRQLAEVQGQPYGGYGQGNPNNRGQAVQPQGSGGQAGYGMPMERKETVQNPLAQDAGKLNRMLQKYHQGQDPRDAQDAIEFINQHPGIKASNVSGIRFNHSDRNEDPMVSLLGDDGNPVKQFYLSSLSNLNNFAGQKKQTYDAGNKGASDPGKLMEQLREQAAVLAEQKLASTPGLSAEDRNKLLPKEIQNQLNQLMKPYQPRNPGYMDNGPVQYQNDNPDFDLFGPRGAQGGGPGYQDVIDNMLGNNQQEAAPPPPPSATAQPKRGQGYGFGGNSMLPGDWRRYLPQNNPNYR